MKLNVHALSLAAGIFTAASIFIVGILNLAWPGYGGAFLKMMASIYPGYQASGTIGEFGWIFGWLYNQFTPIRAGGRKPPPIEP